MFEEEQRLRRGLELSEMQKLDKLLGHPWLLGIFMLDVAEQFCYYHINPANNFHIFQAQLPLLVVLDQSLPMPPHPVPRRPKEARPLTKEEVAMSRSRFHDHQPRQ